jgi:hypothetical protein
MCALLIGVAKHTESLEDYKIYVSPYTFETKHMYLINDLSGLKMGLYQHYKGKKYLVIGVAEENPTEVAHVIYICLYDNELSAMWARPLTMFMGDITVDGVVMPRFKLLAT